MMFSHPKGRKGENLVLGESDESWKDCEGHYM